MHVGTRRSKGRNARSSLKAFKPVHQVDVSDQMAPANRPPVYWPRRPDLAMRPGAMSDYSARTKALEQFVKSCKSLAR